MPDDAASAQRQLYQEWIEDQIEDFKDSVSRSDLLRIAEEACEELRVSHAGQYQITELLLMDAVDRKIIRMLKLPNFQMWSRNLRDGRLTGVADADPGLECVEMTQGPSSD